MTITQRERPTVKVAEAKGRPLLTWVGKRPLRHVAALPAQEVERFALEGLLAADTPWDDWPSAYPRSGLLFHGDNKEVLGHLLGAGFRAAVDLVYVDPPFDSAADYLRRVHLRGARGSARLDGEGYTLGEQVQYTDIWANDNYLQFMYERLTLIRELLRPGGLLLLHCDSARGHHLRCLLDEVLGADQFINEIVWKRSDAHSDSGQGAKHLGAIHDSILLYSNGKPYTWNDLYLPLPQSTVDNWYRNVEEGTGRRFNKADVTGPGGNIKGNPVYEWRGITRAWRFSRERMEQLEREGRLVYSESGQPYLKRYLDESKGVPLQDWWDDIQMVRGIQRRDEDRYPTEKPEALLERIISLASKPGDLVLDCFVGAGTTAVVAQRMGRRWIAADVNKGAIQTSAKGLIDEMTRQSTQSRAQQTTVDGDEPVLPTQLSFATYRVNDYDLAIQHNEAVELACRALGVERLKTDGFFDGTLGRQLVRILPFDHPASPLDVEEVIAELRNRPTEERDVVIIALGKELACDVRLAEHNRPGAPNGITLIELRTDPKLAGFFAHEPASAEVRLEEADGRVRVVIDDFVSPTILERLRQQDGLVSPQVTDWRAMVDSVMVDPSYDGAVFEVGLADVPERKSDLVAGRYELPSGSVGEAVAVKVTDMLGEEVLLVLGREGAR
jgi:adenine-specific DNA-methyltransferase